MSEKQKDKSNTLANLEMERSTRKQTATMTVVTVATDQVGVSARERPSPMDCYGAEKKENGEMEGLGWD